MKTKFKSKLLSILLVLVMALALVAVGTVSAFASGGVNYVDFKIQDESGVVFSSGDSGFQRVTLKGDKTPEMLPDLYRTDSLDYEFNGWYYGGVKVTESTVFDDYAIIYDRWTPVSYDASKIISSLSLSPALPTVGMTQADFKAACTEVSKTGLWVNSAEDFTLYSDLNAMSGSELTETVVAGKSYSAKITLRVDYSAGYRIGKDFMTGVTTEAGIISDVSYVPSNGSRQDYWSTDVRMVDVVINFPYNDFVEYPKSQYISNGTEFHAKFSTTFPSTRAILQHRTEYNTWCDLYEIRNVSSAEFVLPAFTDSTETFRIYTAFPGDVVEVGEDFTLVFGKGASDADGYFIMQPPSSVDLALNEGYTVPYLFSREFNNMWLDMWKGYWAERVQFHNNGLTVVSGIDYATSIGYRIAVAYEYDGEIKIKYSDMFTLNWIDDATSWTVSFLPNGGGGTMADATDVSGSYTVPECTFTPPVGKEFEQWVCDGVRYNPGDTIDITRARIFVALWKPAVKDSYDITFSANGGSGTMNTVLAKHEEEYTAPACSFTPPPGKKFDSWWVGGATVYAGDTLVIKKDLELIANWIDDTYDVSFDKNGGDGEMPIAKDSCANYTLPDCTFTAPSGMQFVGWAAGSSTATPIASGKTVQLTENTTLYAIWDYNDPYVITYNSGSDMKYFSLPEGLSFNVATFESLGFTAPVGKAFSHWRERWTSTERVDEGTVYTVPNDEVFFDAVYVPTGEVVCTVQFSTGTQSGYMEPVDVVSGSTFTIPKPEFVAPAGTEFVGWALGGDITKIKKPFDTITVSGTTDLVAVWRTPLEIDAQYDGRVIAGECLDDERIIVSLVYDDGYTELISVENVNIYYNLTLIPDITQYEIQEAGIIHFVVKYESYPECTLGVIAVNEYKVTFVGAGGGGEMLAEAVQSSTYILPENKFIAPDKKVFKNWSVEGNDYAAGTQITLTSNTVVTAVWESLYTVSFDARGGGGTMMSATAKGGEFTLPHCSFTAPEGKRFVGWSTASGGEVIKAATYTVGADITLYAVWENIPVPPPAHTHDYGTAWKTDANNHWKECECGEKSENAAHIDGNGDNKCDTCDYAMPTHDPDDPGTTPPADNPPTDDDGGLGAGAIVGIVSGSVAVAGVGGFALFWFVIKKKSFADLIAVFKKK